MNKTYKDLKNRQKDKIAGWMKRASSPKRLKKGVLSEDGIYNMLERNKEILKILDGFDS